MDFLDFHHHSKSKFGIYNLNYREKEPGIPFSAGLHPKDISDNWESDFALIKELSLSPRCIAIGECGLDGLIDVKEQLQQKILQQHLAWAEEIKKPVIIHCVRRFSQLLHYKHAKIPKIIHGYNKKPEIANTLLAAGFYLSFGKAALEHVSLQKLIEGFPIDKMFLETDDADFEIAELYERIAIIKEISLDDLKNQMWENLESVTNYG